MFSGQLSDIYFVYFVRTLPFSLKGETLCLRDNLRSNYITWCRDPGPRRCSMSETELEREKTAAGTPFSKLTVEESDHGRSLSRRKRIRAAHRASATRMIRLAEELLDAEVGADLFTRLKQRRDALAAKGAILRTLDEEILGLVDEGDLEEEIDTADIIQERIELISIELERVLNELRSSTTSRTSTSISGDVRETGVRQELGITHRDIPDDVRKANVRHESGTPHRDDGDDKTERRELGHVTTGEILEHRDSSHTRVDVTSGEDGVNSRTRSERGTSMECSPGLRDMEGGVIAHRCSELGHVANVKLPKLSLKKFRGDLTRWATFWDTFESAIHNNSSLSDIDKFNYLNSLLEATASEAIAGLTLTSANYHEAILTLKRRFGNKQLIINRHMDLLLHLESVTSINNLRGLRQFLIQLNRM